MSKLSNFRGFIFILYVSLAGTVSAKLPPPTPEELAAAQAAKQKAAADAAVEQAALMKVQDRIASQYIQQQKAKGITVTPTPIANSAAPEVPSAALNSRPTEKAGAYNESVTPQTAPGASSGAKGQGASTPQDKEVPARK